MRDCAPSVQSAVPKFLEELPPYLKQIFCIRDFASRMMAAICKNFHTSTNNIQTRVTKMFSDALKSDRAPLVSYYGAIAGLQELGPEVIKVFILPHISSLAQKIDIGMPSATVIPYFSSVLEGLWIRIHFFADPGFGSSPFFC